VVPSQLMSKDVNGKSAQKIFPAQQPTASYTSLVEQHAAQLMDELFQDLTPDLEGSSQSSVRTSHSRHPERSDLALRIPLEDDSVLEGLIVPFVEMDATLESLFPPIPNEPISSQPSEGFVSKALLGIACLSLVGSVCLWIGTQFHRSTANPAIAQVPTVLPAANPDNAAFAEDLKHSLEEAPADTVAQSSPLAAIPTAAAATAAPSGLFAANLPTAIDSLPPLSSPALKLPIRNAPNASQIFAMPNLASRKLASPPSVNFTATKTTPTTRLPTLTAAVLPSSLSNGLTNGLTAGNPAASSHVPPVGQSAGRSAKAGITVQGILDLGDKSAILIARNGSTQNVHTGEVLDSTGWVFLRIENGQAIIQRGSEIRSVSGGEQF
jgi:hypothetical protein